MIRVFIVDDHPMVIEGIRSMLLQLPEMEVAGHAMNAASCLGYFVKNTADVVLLDINLPDQSGMELCNALLKRNPEMKIIALTNLDQLTYLQGMKEAGACGYLLKNSAADEIELAIRKVMEGKETWLGRDDVRDSIHDHNRLLLTRRELEVLKLIAEGLTNHEIAEKLFVSDSTVDSHRKNLISKLQVKNTAALVRTALERKII
ncbi:MAG: response regulator transcription factor [Cyclobacteriaceae bacterium]|nr:response regulator transcription factor [Cyclobacteriaceae bacterium]UYN85340.1 MAG: response regulator transcription factor [Cyclobacteriaceae bacterium]